MSVIKGRLIQRGEHLLEYDGEDAEAIREALRDGCAKGAVPSDLYDITDTDRSDLDPEEHLTLTEDGRELWSGWLGGIDAPPPVDRDAQEQLAALTAERDKAYRERAALVAYLAANYRSVIMHDADPDAPGWSVIFVETPSGQMSWHLAESDLELFGHVPKVLRHYKNPWDGHTTDEKYQRLAELTSTVATGIYGPAGAR